MSILNDNILSDPIDVLFDINVCIKCINLPSRSLLPHAQHMRESIINAADARREWFAKSIYNLKATYNDEFTSWLCDVLTSSFPSWEIMVGTYVCFWYGVPEVPDRMITISIETIGHGNYQLKIFDKRFRQLYHGIDPKIYDKFLQSQPSGTNGYDLLNAILLNKLHKSQILSHVNTLE